MEQNVQQIPKPPKIKRGIIVGLSLMFISLGIGMGGFQFFADMNWEDSFLNAAMLLTGMGPVDEPTTAVGKIFAGVYALYSGIIFLSLVAIMVVPIIQKYMNHYAIDNHEECDPDEE